MLLAAEGLRATSKGARIKFSGGKTTVIDGPFTGSKELIAGFWLIQVKSKEEAIAWMKRAPFADGAVLEIRQVFETADFAPSDAHLLGRVTYQGFSAAWPSRTDQQGFADRMNGLPKFVVSTTLEKVEWNNSHLIKKNVAEQVSKLKQQPGQDILVAGNATLVNTLVEYDLVDEYHLLVYPVILGSGKRLFKDMAKPANLKLLEAKSFTTGVVLLSYEPERK